MQRLSHCYLSPVNKRMGRGREQERVNERVGKEKRVSERVKKR